MAKEDFYKILGVGKNASDAELKKSYKRLAMKFHPDRNTDNPTQAEKKFKQAKQAYEILTDPKKRAVYDQFGHGGIEQGMGGGSRGFEGAADFSDIFGDIFGGSTGNRKRSDVRSGDDLAYNLELRLEDAVNGIETSIRVPLKIVCGECKGSGAKKGSSPVSCSTCQGHGQVRMQQGFFSVQQTCPTCRGSGSRIKDPCRPCRGQGRIQDNKTLSVKVPSGVDNGDRIRLSGEGEAGINNGPHGDLYIQIQVKEHAIFSREGANLLCEIPINFPTACLGGEIEVPTLNGKVKLKIPAETQTGKLFRLRGKGVKPVRNRVTGDLFCKIQIETPVRLTKEQKTLLTTLQDSLSDSKQRHNPQEHGWTDGVKRFFDKLTKIG